MKYLLCLVVAIACEAARVPRIIDQGYFQNYQGAFPNNDPSGYHNVPGNGAGAAFFGDYRNQEGQSGLESEFFPNQASLGCRQDLNHLAEVPFGYVGASQANFRAENYGRSSNDYNFPA
ncbi:uncharacterized protein LOC143362948 [Halictus rubicundus]|uniref:uncharacterized protein LOC143362948 n=1 Tax=Halictus rubicundus TaxID=77578 RepID=UPI004036A558